MKAQGMKAIYQHASLVVEAYQNVREHDSAKDWVEGIGEQLDDLCRAFGKEPPETDGVFDKTGRRVA